MIVSLAPSSTTKQNMKININNNHRSSNNAFGTTNNTMNTNNKDNQDNNTMKTNIKNNNHHPSNNTFDSTNNTINPNNNRNKENNTVKNLIRFSLGTAMLTLAMFATAQEGEYVSNQIIVGFQRGQEREARAFLSRLGYEEQEYDETLNASEVRLPDRLDPRIAAERVRANRAFAYAEPNYYARATAVPSDPLFNSQWGPWHVGTPCAWNMQIGNPGMRIAIIDTGVDFVHPDLGGKVLNNGWDFVNNDPLPQDDHGHGTHCAGIAAGMPNNNVGISGMDWNARILPIEVLNAGGSGTYWNVAQGIIYAAHPNQGNAQILSLSLAGGAPSAVLQSAVQFAHSNRRLIVAAASNTGSQNPAYPAFYSEAIAVGASTIDDSQAPFSNYGSWVDVAAPGVNILSSLWTSSGSTWASWNGTSMATPMVAGLAGLVWSQMGSTATSSQVRQRIESTCDPVKGGAWVVNGRINAFRAVAGSLSGNTWLNSAAYQLVLGTPSGPQTLNRLFTANNTGIAAKSVGGLGNRRVHFAANFSTTMCPASIRTLTISMRLKDSTVMPGVRTLFVKNQRTGNWDPIGGTFGVGTGWLNVNRTITTSATSFAAHYVDVYTGKIELRLEALEPLSPFTQTVDLVRINSAY